MTTRWFAIVLLLLSGCTSSPSPARWSGTPPPKALQPFGYFLAGEWTITFQSGTSMTDTWDWGPGRHSVQVQTQGWGAGGEPWQGIQVLYWHPKDQRIASLGLSPFARGISEGTVRFDGKIGSSEFDLHQTMGLRKMGTVTQVLETDRYHEALNEYTERGLGTLVAFDFVRSADRSPPPRHPGESLLEPSPLYDPIRPLIGRTWRTTAMSSSKALDLDTSVEWLPYVDAVVATISAVDDDSPDPRLFQIYVFHHTGTDRLECLALSRWGGVWRGTIESTEEGALLISLSELSKEREPSRQLSLHFSSADEVYSSIEGLRDPAFTDLRHSALPKEK